MNAFALIKNHSGAIAPSLKRRGAISRRLIYFQRRPRTGRVMSLESLVNRLSAPVFKLGRPVVDETGIEGIYDFTLVWTPDGAVSDAADSAPSILTASQEQLGLRLEPRKITAPALIVDRVERVPSANLGYA